MSHLPALIQDLALILATAAAVSLLMRRFQLPLLVGYLIAGFLVGPELGLMPKTSDPQNLRTWAELGVIFLLFNMGLEFSFKRLAELGGSLLLVCFIEMSALFFLGYSFGHLFNWPTAASLFLGAMVCISSTAVVVKSFDELNLKTQKFAQTSLGILVIEDLFALGFMVALTTVGLTTQFQGFKLIISVLELIFFLSIFLIFGIFTLPFLFRKIKSYLTDEVLLLISLGLCLLVTRAASAFGFSAALGAFLIGSIIGDSTDRHRVQTVLEPIRNLFSAVFFVSIGMLMDPSIFIGSPGFLAGLVLIVILGKFLFVGAGSLLAGHPLPQALTQGMSLGQIGEFSFLIAALATKSTWVPLPLESLAAALCIITSFTTPLILAKREPIIQWIESALPRRMVRTLGRWSQAARFLQFDREISEVQRQVVSRILVNGVIVTTVFWSASRFLPKILLTIIPDSWVMAASYFASLVISLPFLWAFVLSYSKPRDWTRVLKIPPPERFLWNLILIRLVLCVSLVGFLTLQFWNGIEFWGFIGGLISFFCALLILLRFVQPTYSWIESSFVLNWQGPAANHQPTPNPQRRRPSSLASWEGHLAEFKINPEATFLGQRLGDLPWKEQFGINVTLIERGSQLIVPPTRDDRLMPYDRILVIGTDEQLKNFSTALSGWKYADEQRHFEDFQMTPVVIPESFPNNQFTLSDLALREKSRALVVAIERAGTKILSPNAKLLLQAQDVLWVFGDSKMIEIFTQQLLRQDLVSISKRQAT